MGMNAYMTVRLPSDVSEEKVKELSWLLGAVFGADWFDDSNSLHFEKDCKGRKVYSVAFSSIRHYGVFYERGPALLFINVAEFIEHHLPGCDMFYSDDGDPNPEKPFGHSERQEMKRHFFNFGNIPYRGKGKPNHGTKPDLSSCKRCVSKYDMHYIGGTGDGTISQWECPGCGLFWLTENGGKVWGIGKGIKSSYEDYKRKTSQSE